MFYIEISVSKLDEKQKPIAWIVYQRRELIGWIDLNPDSGKFEYQRNSKSGLLDPGSEDEIHEFISDANAQRGDRKRTPARTALDIPWEGDGIKL